MYDFECHYRKERWQTAPYFDFVKEFLIAAQNRDNSDDCDPPPCPTTPHTVTTEENLTGEYHNIMWFIYMCVVVLKVNKNNVLPSVTAGFSAPHPSVLIGVS